ncbi:MAG: hypothetical protein FJ217_15965 [Ignavibacteria bacterium]|nr:hypothetical protein [Ignavibacteria bacterium]
MGTNSSFGTFEAVRILAPGYYFATLLLVFYWSVLSRYFSYLALDSLSLLLTFVAVGMVAGLTLYAKESTKRRKAFQENQPSFYLKSKSRTMSGLRTLEESEARQLYFYILNNHMPPLFHEKIFFFGVVYHIMIQIRRTSFWFAVLAPIALAIELSAGRQLPELQSLIAFTVIVWIIYLLNVRYNKADRKMQENYQDQIYWLEMNNDLVESILRKRYSTEP